MSPRKVRMGMSAQDAEAVDAYITGRSAEAPEVDQLLDQLWLRTILLAQRRQAQRDERARYGQRADELLARLDPTETA